MVEHLLAEGVNGARERESCAYESLAGPLGTRIVLFGAGGLGRRCLAGLRHYGIEPLAFADNNSKLWGKEMEGLPVLEPRQAAARFGETAVFVITIWGAFSADRMMDRVNQVRALGCATVVPFGPLLWRYPERSLPHYAVDLPHHLIEKADDILCCFDLWADDESRQEYVAQLQWRLSFDFGAMAPPKRDAIYFPPGLLELDSHEVFVDCGAFDGDTLGLFLRQSKSAFARAFALEPDPANFARLSASVAVLPEAVRSRIELKCAAVGAREGKVRFSAHGTASSSVGAGDLEVDCVTLDRFLGGYAPTFIKMDIEGAEPDAIRGAAAVIREHSPTLATCCYHLQDHLWSIPLLIQSLNPNYNFYLRPHDLEGWDLVCYAIPRSHPRPA